MMLTFSFYLLRCILLHHGLFRVLSFAITTDDSWLVAAAETIRAFASSLLAKKYLYKLHLGLAFWVFVVPQLSYFSPPNGYMDCPTRGETGKRSLSLTVK
ncbi:hypothetical protein V8C34DRAFT_72493 [Trichoderma compactum]